MSPAELYSYRVQWSAEDEAYVGTVAEMPSLSWVADSHGDAFDGIIRLVAEVVEDMRDNGEQPPDAIADRSFSGKVLPRIPPETHRQLALEAAEQHVSLNRLISSRLVS